MAARSILGRMKARKFKPTQRASVTLQPGGRTNRAKRWAYGYDDLARLLGSTPGSMRTKVYNGWEPTLEAVVTAVVERRRREANVYKDLFVPPLAANIPEPKEKP